MAGYIFNLDSFDSLRTCIEYGIYSTNLSQPTNGQWKIHHEGTFADYLSMKPGDNIYFFIKRKIYGIGELVNVGLDCKYQNYPNAIKPFVPDYQKIQNDMLDSSLSTNNRVICTFIPSPNFFENGIDMDDVLSSNPQSFKMLRAFWKLSFIKIDDMENKALIDIILKRNEMHINSQINTFKFNSIKHSTIVTKANKAYLITSNEVLKNSSTGNFIRHEMALEAGIIDIIASKQTSPFGNWDYISHQVVASPFKPIDYMDKMDIFGYRYISNFSTISKYLVIEIKKDAANLDAIDQLMKYVDWINQEYSYGDYSMIEAYLVAYDFPQVVIDYKNQVAIRNFTKGSRPTISETWTNIKLIKYEFNTTTNSLDFIEII